MKRILQFGLLFSCASCLSNESPIRVGPAFTMTGTTLGQCTLAAVGQTGGDFDVAGLNVGANYVIGVELQSDLNAPIVPDTLNNNQGSKTANDFIFNQIQLGYQAVPAIGGLPATEATAASGAVNTGANGTGSWLGLFLFGPKAAQVLPTAVATGTTSTVTVTVSLKGALRSGESLTSNSYAYPITVFNSGFTGCPATVKAAANGPCGTIGSQDGSRAVCCVAAGPDAGLPAGC
jgi:hypothetical protein